MQDEKLRAYLYLHFCVLIWGFTAILGKLISIEATPLVWWRVTICCATLLLIIPRAQFRELSRKTYLNLLGIGVLVGVHWLCFYGAIKLANASVAVACMALASFFSAFTEPLLLRQRIKWYELAIGVGVVPGMWLIAGNIDVSMIDGLIVGTGAALLAAIFTALNKKVVEQEKPPPALLMSFVEMFAGIGVTSIGLGILWVSDTDYQFMPQGMDWLWMLLLAWVCTLLPYYLTLKALRYISAFATNLTINLEPVYGVILAALIFQEHKDLDYRFYIGVGIILIAVFAHPFVKNYFERPKSKSA
jgi:drug/metabolite transporter (DMT)-like permease